MEHYLIMYHPPREGFAENATPEESAIIEKHFAYLAGLHKKGQLLMAGRIADARFGIALLEVENEAQAQELMKNDPAVAGGVFTGELLPFRMALI